MSTGHQGRLFAEDPQARGRALVLAADPLGVAQEHRAGRLTPITPNERAAKALRGRRAASPSLGNRAARTVLTTGLHVAGPLSRLSALREVIAAEGAWSDVRGTARRFQPVVSELLRVGLAAREGALDAVTASQVVGTRSVTVARLAVAYSRHLLGRGEVDPAELLWRGAAAVKRTEPLLVSGYSRLGAGELAFLDALAGPGSVVTLPLGFGSSEDAASTLAAMGWAVERIPGVGQQYGPRLAARFTAAVSAREGGEPDAGEPPVGTGGADAPRAVLLANEEDEVRWVLAEVKRTLDSGTSPDDVVLIARDERAYGPLVRAIAHEFGVPVRLAYSVPLRETRLGELVGGLVAAVGLRLPFEETARLFGHPLTRALTPEVWEKARARHPEGPIEWVAAGVEVAGALAWPGKATWTDYLTRLREALEALGVTPRAVELDGRALARLLRTLERSALTHQDGSTVLLSDFLGYVSDVLDVMTLPVDRPGPGKVELHTPLAIFGARYQHVCVLGMTEGSFPQSVAQDAVIDFHERRTLAEAGLELEDAEGAAEREELSFLAVLHAAQTGVTLTVPELQGGSESLPSAYLKAVGVERPERAQVRVPASDGERLLVELPLSTGEANRAWRVERRRESAEPPDLYDGIAGISLPVAGPYSATQLTSFGQCSFKWYAQYGLGLGELTEAEEEVSPLTAGSLFHTTLQRAVARARDESEGSAGSGPVSDANGRTELDPVRAAVIRNLEEAYDEAHAFLEKRGGRIRSKTWPLQRRENLDKLRRLVSSDDFLLPETRVADLEVEFRAVWRGLPVRGVVDRIDVGQMEEAEVVVLTDYKLGKSPPKGAKGPKGALNLDLQLPLYIEAAAPALHAGARVAGARYLSINGASVSREVDPEAIDSGALDGLVNRFRTALGEGAFPLDPDVDQQACEYCPFDAVCRRGPRLSRKAARHAAEQVEEAAA